MNEPEIEPKPQNRNRTYAIQLALFIVTFITTTVSGSEWMTGRLFLFSEEGFGFGKWMDLHQFFRGMYFSVPFLGILTFHEFGHYFTARWYKIKVTLPYYIPLWFGLGTSIGTMGAFIRIKQNIRSRKEYFDIGVAGPLAGFVVAVGVLLYGFTHLPPAEYIFTIHPEYQQYGLDYAKHVYNNLSGSMALGQNLLFWFFEHYVTPDPSLVPNSYEMMHYPFLFAGYLACFFTALNLMPIGQLDGGHILYGLVGSRWHSIISPALFVLFVFYAGLGWVTPYMSTDQLANSAPLYLLFLLLAYGKMVDGLRNTLLLSMGTLLAQFGVSYFFPYVEGYNGWMLFALILGRFLGVYHPKAEIDQPLTTGRKIVGWISLVIFILCFSPSPFIVK